MKKFGILTVAAMISASLLSGCSTHALVEKTMKATETHDQDASAQIEVAAAKAKNMQTDPAETDVNVPYIAGAPVALAREVTLPPALRKGIKTEVLFKGAEKVDLMDAAAELTLATGIPVRVRPDALIPQSNFLPKGAQGGTGTAPQGGGGGQQSVMVNLKVSEAPVADILNFIAVQTGCNWQWRPDQGIIEIYRLVTKTFEFRGLAGSGSVSIGLGRTGGGSSSSSFESNASTKFEEKDLDSVKHIKASIDALMTRGGSGSITDGGTIVVTDTKEAVDSIETYLNDENKRMNRRVRLLVQAVDVSMSDTGEAGVDWTLVYSKIAQKLTGNVTNTLSLSSPQTVTGSTGGALTIGVSGNSKLNGTSAAIDALREIGNVTNVTRVPVVTQNRRPVQFAVRNTFDYVSSIQVTTVASSSGTTTAPQITQKEETVGTTLTITPAAFDDGSIALHLAYDNTTLRSLTPYSAGDSSSTTNTVQQRNIDGTGTDQSVTMRSGQTLFISGIERNTNSVTTARLDNDLPMAAGGSDQAKKSKTTTIILVTAVAEDGI
jgi:type IVB pilus formation R64 PilN family outer membrane protein